MYAVRILPFPPSLILQLPSIAPNILNTLLAQFL